MLIDGLNRHFPKNVVLVAGDEVLGSEREKRKKKKGKRMFLDGLNRYFPKTVVLVAGDVRGNRTKNQEPRTKNKERVLECLICAPKQCLSRCWRHDL